MVLVRVKYLSSYVSIDTLVSSVRIQLLFIN